MIIRIILAFLASSIQLFGQTTVGGQKDSHGCLLSAGYQWSEIKRTCIRSFELKPKLYNQNKSFTAGIIFSISKQQAEVFCKEGHSTLKRSNNKAYYGKIGRFYVELAEEKGKWILRDLQRKIWYKE